MKIAFLNIYNGIVERGAEVFVSELAEKLSNKHDVTIFQAGENKGKNYKIIKITKIPYLPHQGYSSKLFGRIYTEIYHLIVLYFTLKCLPYLWKNRYDWIIPINGRWQVLICRLFRFLRRGKILISGQAGVGFDDKWDLLLGEPDIFVALTPTAYTWAKSIYNQEKIVQIPNGVDIDRFVPTKSTIKLPLSKPIILCVSALLPYKRIELLISAVENLNEVSLLIIGDGPLREKINQIGKELLQNRFHLISCVPHEELVKYYNSCQLFSLPSRESEAFGIVYVEAMACNLPVVAPDDINRKQIIGEAGILTFVEDTKKYAETLNKALKADFGDKPRKQAEKFFWQEIARQYEQVFEEK